MVESHGTIELALAGLRHYWKLIAGTAAILIGCGVFLNKFDTLIEGQKAAILEFKALHSDQTATTVALTALTTRVGAVEKSEQERSILEKAIGEAAHITVTPITPVQNAPAEVREGKIHR